MEFEGDVTISSDTEVMDYYAYDKITGNLLIESTDITKLDLPELKELGGSLIITYNEFLKDVSELGNLKSIGGDFKVTHNDGLSEVSVEALRDQSQAAGGIKGQVDRLRVSAGRLGQARSLEPSERVRRGVGQTGRGIGEMKVAVYARRLA